MVPQSASLSLDETETFLNLWIFDVGRGHVPADREAADGTDEQICTQSVVPAPAGTCPRPTKADLFMIEIANSRLIGGEQSGIRYRNERGEK